MKFSITFADNSVYFSPIFDILYGINMIPIVIFKKILLFLAPLLVFYFLRKIGRKKTDKKQFHLNIDRSKIVEGEIVEEKK